MKFDNIEFKPTITLAEKARLITEIVDSLFVDEDYLPEVFEEQFWINVATTYAVEEIDGDFTSDDFMDNLYNQGVMERLTDTVNKNQLDAIRAAVLKRIEMRLSRKPFDEFFEKATALLVKLESAVDGIDLKGAIDGFSKLDISADLAKALAKNIAPKEESENVKPD